MSVLLKHIRAPSGFMFTLLACLPPLKVGYRKSFQLSAGNDMLSKLSRASINPTPLTDLPVSLNTVQLSGIYQLLESVLGACQLLLSTPTSIRPGKSPQLLSCCFEPTTSNSDASQNICPDVHQLIFYVPCKFLIIRFISHFSLSFSCISFHRESFAASGAISDIPCYRRNATQSSSQRKTRSRSDCSIFGR